MISLTSLRNSREKPKASLLLFFSLEIILNPSVRWFWMGNFSKSWKYWVFLGISIAIFCILTYKGLFVRMPGDEHKWYYSGYLVSEGYVPYKDFFYGHPPIQALLLSLIFKMVGFNILALKLVPFVSAILISVLLFLILKENHGSVCGITAAVLFLFSYSVMFNSSVSFGVMLAAMMMMLGYYFLEKERYWLAGSIFALAALTRLLVLLPILTIFAWIMFTKRRQSVQRIAFFAAIFGGANIVLAALFGNGFIDPVYRLHLLKDPISALIFSEYYNMVALNWVLALFFILSIVYFLAVERKINLPLLVGIIYITAMLFIKRLYGYYFIPAFPFIAMSCGIAISDFLKKTGKRAFVIAACALLLALFIWDASANALFINRQGFPGFDRLDDIKQYINSNFDETYEIFGDDSLAPLLALETGRKVALNHFETNDAVFESDIIDLDSLLKRLNGKKIMFIARTTQGMSKFSETREFLSQCEFMSQFNDKIENGILIYKCN
jgi:hypothetical protein